MHFLSSFSSFEANGFNRLLHGSMGDVKQLLPINVLRVGFI